MADRYTRVLATAVLVGISMWIVGTVWFAAYIAEHLLRFPASTRWLDLLEHIGPPPGRSWILVFVLGGVGLTLVWGGLAVMVARQLGRSLRDSDTP